MNFVTLTPENIADEHICCAITSKECTEGYELKKQWLRSLFDEGYVFRRLDARAKVFIEYGPADKAWLPVDAPGYLLVNCLWVSGQYKGKGYAKALLQSAVDDARQQGMRGLVTVVGTKKYHFMSDTKWLLAHGFVSCQQLPSGFSLLVMKLDDSAPDPQFATSALSGCSEHAEGLVAYYSNRCPFTEYYVNSELEYSAQKRNMPLKIIKLDTREKAYNSPSPATIFSLFYNGKFVTTDISACMDSKLDKILANKK